MARVVYSACAAALRQCRATLALYSYLKRLALYSHLKHVALFSHLKRGRCCPLSRDGMKLSAIARAHTRRPHTGNTAAVAGKRAGGLQGADVSMAPRPRGVHVRGEEEALFLVRLGPEDGEPDPERREALERAHGGRREEDSHGSGLRTVVATTWLPSWLVWLSLLAAARPFVV